ncbi:MAG TPA: PEGA domain-containing protein, partial [Methanosarcinaceae archaeon]|nr:PEGA domain-containing protein [Methanosarcinaceae archaeon]
MTKRAKYTIPKIILLLLILTSCVNVERATAAGQIGSVAIISDQTYSDIYIDGAYFGQTGSDLVWYDLSVGTHRIKIIQSGYDDWTDSIYVSSDEVAYVEAYLIQQIEQTGSVAIWSDQTYSDIYIDGAYFGQTGSDLVWYDLSVGTHRIKIIQSGYDDWTDSIYVSSDEVAYV